MTALVVCALLFLTSLAVVLGVSFSPAPPRMFNAIPAKVTAWFALSALLGFTLVNDILKIEYPVELTVTLMLAFAAGTSVLRRLVIPEASILRDMLPAIAGIVLFASTRFVMHAIGMNIVDQFEVFLD